MYISPMVQPESIKNAGLVLLNPFLPTLFSRLGLIENGQFKNTAAQDRAVILLQYVVTANSIAADLNLALPKILCGLSPEENVPSALETSAEETTVADELLQVVIRQWDKLKNTSVDALRSSFLEREGSLMLKDEAWHLNVEQRGYDVLLQTLPWNIGMIKTSWMPRFLYVEWQ